MKNIEMSTGTTTYRDRDRDNSDLYVRFSANFDSETEQLQFLMQLNQLVLSFKNPSPSPLKLFGHLNKENN